MGEWPSSWLLPFMPLRQLAPSHHCWAVKTSSSGHEDYWLLLGSQHFIFNKFEFFSRQFYRKLQQMPFFMVIAETATFLTYEGPYLLVF